jgi:ABC-type transport system involved in cytochrome c biogenesis permease component
MGRSFLLVLGVALALSFLAWFVYQSAAMRAVNAVNNPTLSQAQTEMARSSIVGRDLFVALASGNSLIWLFLAAALAASGVARERERGLLESLQLSRMTAKSQIFARLAANGLLLLVLQAVTLPIYGVAFLMGGISPGEVAAALYVVVWAAILGSALGLWFSARAHRPTGALFSTLGTLIGWSFAVFWGFVIYSDLRRIPGSTPSVAEAFIYAHPTALFARLLDSGKQFYFDTSQITLIVSSFWAVASLFLVWDATRWVGRTLPPPSWQGRAPWLQKRIENARAEVKQRAQMRHEKAQSKASEKMQGALLADLPIERLVNFRDPLLSREVKSRFRLRRAGFWVSLVRVALALFAIGFWTFAVSWLSDPISRNQMAPNSLRALLYCGVGVLATLAATSFTRERESGTWESLKLSLLSPRELLRAKWRSPLISFAYYSAPLLVLLPIGALFIDIGAFGVALMVVVVWLGLTVALGLWVSWRAPNSTSAIAWTAGVLLMLLVGLPWINAIARVDESLARWTYGVGSGGRLYKYSDNYLYDSNGSYQPAVIARYQADTGDQSVFMRNTPFGQRYGSRTGSIEEWITQQQNKSRTLVALMWTWHPGDALNTLLRPRNLNPEPNPYTGQTERQNADMVPVMMVASVAAPFLMSLLLLALLQRDVRREQLNS